MQNTIEKQKAYVRFHQAFSGGVPVPIVVMSRWGTLKGQPVEWWSTIVFPYSAHKEIVERLARATARSKRCDEAIQKELGNVA